MAKVIFENDLIKVTEAEHGCKPFVTIENKTNERICVHYDEPGYNDNYDSILIESNHFAILLENEEGRDWVEAFKTDWFYICGVEDESEEIIFRSDLEDIQNEIDRILKEYEFKKKVHNEQVYNSNKLVTVLEILKQIY